MSARHKFFAAALLLSAVRASDHISNAYQELDHTNEPKLTKGRFNLESALHFADLHIAEAETMARAHDSRGSIEEPVEGENQAS